jgi:peroxiredoxin
MMRARLAVVLLAAAGLIGIVHAEFAGTPAPDFALKSVNGKNYRLSEYRGRVVLLSFGASWCGECRAQLETLTGIHERYAGSGLELLAVSLDRDMHQVDDFARALDIEFPTLHDAGGAVGERYAVKRMPYVVLIDQEGIVRGEYVGFSKGEEQQYLAAAGSLLTD